MPIEGGVASLLRHARIELASHRTEAHWSTRHDPLLFNAAAPLIWLSSVRDRAFGASKDPSELGDRGGIVLRPSRETGFAGANKGEASARRTEHLEDGH